MDITDATKGQRFKLRIGERCSFARAYIQRHPEYQDLVATQQG